MCRLYPDLSTPLFGPPDLPLTLQRLPLSFLAVLSLWLLWSRLSDFLSLLHSATVGSTGPVRLVTYHQVQSGQGGGAGHIPKAQRGSERGTLQWEGFISASHTWTTSPGRPLTQLHHLADLLPAQVVELQ